MKTVAREKLARDTNPKIKPQDLELVNVTLNHPQVLAFSAAAKALPFILDLAVKFILAPPEAEFVLSDHPAAACNQFVENDPYLSQRNGWTGMAIKGIQMFLPISPQITLAAYDPTTYEYGNTRSRICRANKKDVATLNKLQAITAVNNIYFRESFPDHLLEDLRRDRELQRPIREVNVRLSEVMTRPDGNESRLMSLSCVNFRLGRKFHFIKQLDTESYRNYSGITLPIRNKETYKLYK